MPSNFHQNHFIGPFNLSSQSQTKQSIPTIVDIWKRLIDTVLQEMETGVFPYSQYSFERDSDSGLTYKAGI